MVPNHERGGGSQKNSRQHHTIEIREARERLTEILNRLIDGDVREASITFRIVEDGGKTIIEHVEEP